MNDALAQFAVCRVRRLSQFHMEMDVVHGFGPQIARGGK